MSKSNILIVEDLLSLRDTWELIFSNFGVDIHTAAHGDQAVEILKKHPIEIIVTDLQMPVRDGYYVLEYMQANDIDIITWVCSGQLMPSRPLDEFRVDKILMKPFNMIKEVQEIIGLVKNDNRLS